MSEHEPTFERAPGLCAEHGGLMWSNAMRACITPDDVIRGGCRWQPFVAAGHGRMRHGAIWWWRVLYYLGFHDEQPSDSDHSASDEAVALLVVGLLSGLLVGFVVTSALVDHFGIWWNR